LRFWESSQEFREKRKKKKKKKEKDTYFTFQIKPPKWLQRKIRNPRRLADTGNPQSHSLLKQIN